MSTDTKIIYSASIRSLLNYLDSIGIDTVRLCLHLSIDNQQLDEPTYCITAEKFVRLYKLGARLSTDPDFGLNYGTDVKPERWGILGYMSSVSKNLAEAAALQQTFQGLIGSIGEIKNTVNTHSATLYFETDLRVPRPMAEEMVVGWTYFTRLLSGVMLTPEQVYFKHRESSNGNKLQTFFQCPIQYESDKIAVTFPISYFDYPVKHSDEMILNSLRGTAQRLLRQVEQGSFLFELQAIIEGQLELHQPVSIDDVASAMNMSRRTLQRKIQSEGERYSEILDQVRFGLVKKYLTDGESNLKSMAYNLGYADVSAFHKAFKRWSGVTPKAFIPND